MAVAHRRKWPELLPPQDDGRDHLGPPGRDGPTASSESTACSASASSAASAAAANATANATADAAADAAVDAATAAATSDDVGCSATLPPPRLHVFDYAPGWAPLVQRTADALGEPICFAGCELTQGLGHPTNGALTRILAQPQASPSPSPSPSLSP